MLQVGQATIYKLFRSFNYLIMQFIIFLLSAILLALSAGHPLQVPAPSPCARPVQVAPGPLPVRICVLHTDMLAGSVRPRSLQGRQPARTFFQPYAYALFCYDIWQLGARGLAALTLLAQAEDYGLQPNHYHVPSLRALADLLALPAADMSGYRDGQLVRFDVLITNGPLQFGLNLCRDQLHAFRPSILKRQVLFLRP